MDVALCDGDGVVAFVRAYLDESGTHDGSDVTTVSVILSRPTLWKEWTKAWNVAKAPIKVFHSTDCANFRREFEGWDKEYRDRYVANLLPVIGRFDFIGLVMGIDNRDVARLASEMPGARDTIGSPYMVCLQMALHRTLDYLNELGVNDRIAFVHEDNDFQAEAHRCFDWMKGLPSYRDREMTLSFAPKKLAPPLQAADVFAYEGNKRIRNIDGPERRAWRALNPERSKVRLDHLEYNGIKRWMESVS